MKNLVLASIIGMLSCSVMAASPNDVVRGAADSLLAAIEGRKDELSADRDALFAVADQVLLPNFDRHYAAQIRRRGTAIRSG